jgi:hypothetical protein
VQLCPLPEDSVKTIFLRVSNHKQTGFPEAVRDGINCRFKVQKRSQLFIGSLNETPSVVAVRVRNPDRSALGING